MQSNGNGTHAAPTIIKVMGRYILDSRGNPTVECEVTTHMGMFRAAVPSGISTGIHEAVELRDGGKPFLGKGVSKAVENLNMHLGPAVMGMDPTDQKAVDAKMIKLDGTENKSKYGANAILAISLAVAKAGAAEKGVPLYQHLADLAGNKEVVLPVPSFNVINGGTHAGNALAVQEFMIVPVGASSFREALRMASEVYHTLKTIIKKKYGQDATNVGDEGGFAPCINSATEALDLIVAAIKEAGYTEEMKIGIDTAASELLTADKQYDLNFKAKNNDGSQVLSGDGLLDMYMKLLAEYPIVFLEDPFAEDDWDNFTKITAKGIVGDDLLVTNPKRVQHAIDTKACSSLLLKVNQIGTVTEASEAVRMAKAAGWGVMTSHRSGETEDSFIADLAVGLSTGLIKSGAPCRSERLAKYNQLMRIEEELGANAVYAGKSWAGKKCPC